MLGRLQSSVYECVMFISSLNDRISCGDKWIVLFLFDIARDRVSDSRVCRGRGFVGS